LGEETNTCLATPSCQVVVEKKVSSQLEVDGMGRGWRWCLFLLLCYESHDVLTSLKSSEREARRHMQSHEPKLWG